MDLDSIENLRSEFVVVVDFVANTAMIVFVAVETD